MFKKSFVIALAMMFASSSFALACTQEEAAVKAQAFAEALQAAQSSKPDVMMQAAQAAQTDLAGLQNDIAAGNYDGLCKFYDEWTEKLK